MNHPTRHTGTCSQHFPEADANVLQEEVGYTDISAMVVHLKDHPD